MLILFSTSGSSGVYVPDNLIRDPISGQILALSHGDWTGLYGSDTTVVVPSFEAAFVDPTGLQVGQVAQVRVSNVSPPEASVTVEIGEGTGLSDFVSHVSSENMIYNSAIGAYEGTIPASLDGKVMTARVGATANLIARAAVIDSGVTITTPIPSGFPDNVPASSWTATEVRDEAPAGRRKITLLSSASALYDPAIYDLQLYSGTTNLGLPTQFGATLTPGVDFTTSGSIATGSTCYNSLAWLRKSDGAIQRAHPDNEQKSFTMQGLVITPPPSDDDTYAPDIFVSSAGAMKSTALNLIANNSIPNGETRVIALTASTSGTLDLSNIVVPAGRRIIIRHWGSYADGSGSVIHTGPVNLIGSRGVDVVMGHFRVGGSAQAATNSFRFEGCTDCRVMQNIIEGRAPSLSIPTDIDYTTVFANYVNVGIKNTVDCWFAHNLVRYSGNPQVIYSVNTNLTCVGNMFDLSAADDQKGGGGAFTGRLERNWGCRRWLTGVPGDPHEDFFQFEPTNSTFSVRFYGNVDASVHDGLGARQLSWFAGGNNLSGSKFEQNISLLTSNFILQKTGVAPGTLRYNDSTVAQRDWEKGAPTAWGQSMDYNYWWCRNISTTQVIAGPNGLCRSYGTAAPNYAQMAQDYRYGVPWLYETAANPIALGNGGWSGYAKPRNTQTIRAFEPMPGARTHWLHSNPVGAYLRKREIFDPTYRPSATAIEGYEVFPFAWPVLGQWRAIWNFDGYVADGYTGSWDQVSGKPV